MHYLLAFVLIGLVNTASLAARVYVEASRGGGVEAVGGERSRGDEASRLETRPLEVRHTPVEPIQTVQSNRGHGGHREHGAHTTDYTASRFHTVNGLNPVNPHRVRVIPAPREARHYAGRPYRYSYYHGRPWYGFYVGPRYYWSHYYNNRWWWYDHQWARWSFWYDGYWWYRAGAVTYVYLDGNYIPYQPGVVIAAPPVQFQAAPPIDANAAPTFDAAVSAAPASGDATVTSPDGRRMVQVVGPNSEAFLYDTSSGHAVFMRYLAKNVIRVRFDGGKNHKPLGILVDYSTNSDFTLFDENGTPQGGSIVPSAPAPGSSQPTPPVSAPAAPTDSKEPLPPAPLPG